ncbi:hypothetical protein HDU97_005767 [Phlyctochytrium planicorne]|nr:hypothetical protein HDU97_005767 [Phlyctochytrium planicorne]
MQQEQREAALFSAFVDFGDMEETPSNMPTPDSSNSNSSPALISESDMDATSFLSPPNSNFSPDTKAISGAHLSSFQADSLMDGFCPISDLMLGSLDPAMNSGFVLPDTTPWMNPTMPTLPSLPSTSEVVAPTPEVLMLLRSESANACQQLLSEPVKRKPGRKKKSEIEQKLQQQQQMQQKALQSPPSTSASPPPQVKSESDSEPSSNPNASQPLQPSTTPVPIGLTKKQERMVKNRQAADESRKRKREHLQSLETHAQALITENDGLRARVLELEQLNLKLGQENLALKTALSALDPNSVVLSNAISFGSNSFSIPLSIDSLSEPVSKKSKSFIGGADVMASQPLKAVFMQFTVVPFKHETSKVIGSSRDRTQVPQIEGSPTPLLLPGVPRDLLITSHITTDLSSLDSSSFLVTNPKAIMSQPLSDSIHSSTPIPLMNLEQVLETMTSSESELSDKAKMQIVKLKKLLAVDNSGNMRRVGPYLLPFGENVIPMQVDVDTAFPAAVENYLASLRAQEDVKVLPSGKDVVETALISRETKTVTSASTAAPLFASRFCPNKRRNGPMLSLVANLPTKGDMPGSFDLDGVTDPMKWKEGDLEHELEKWIMFERNDEGGVTGGNGHGLGKGSFLQLDVEVVGARLVTLNDTL